MLGITAPAKDVGASEGMLIGRGEHFIIEIMQHPHQAPFIHVGVGTTVTRRARAHGGLYSQGMLSQAVTLGVLA